MTSVSPTTLTTRKKKRRQLTDGERAIILQVREGPDADDDEHVFESITRLPIRSKWDIALAWLHSQEGKDYVLKYDNYQDPHQVHNYTTLELALFCERCYVPLEVIKAILKINPNATKTPIGRGGDLLIHRACLHREHKKRVQIVVNAYPGSLLERGECRDLPIHCACHLNFQTDPPKFDVIDFLLDACPESLRETDEDGRLPLHHAAGRVRSLDLITKYIKLYPEAVRQTDDAGWLPLHYCLLYDYCDEDYENGAVVDIAKLLIDSYPESIYIACTYQVSHELEQEVFFPKELVRLDGKKKIQKQLITLLNNYEQQYMIALASDVIKQHYSDNKKDVLILRRSRRSCTRKRRKVKYSS